MWSRCVWESLGSTLGPESVGSEFTVCVFPTVPVGVDVKNVRVGPEGGGLDREEGSGVKVGVTGTPWSTGWTERSGETVDLDLCSTLPRGRGPLISRTNTSSNINL